MNIIDAERLNILSEKAKLETLERLKPTLHQSNSTRNEIDAAIKIAQDATRQSDIERENLMENQRQCDVKRRELVHAESLLRSKQSELELRLNEAASQKVIKTKKKKKRKLLFTIFFFFFYSERLNWLQKHAKH